MKSISWKPTSRTSPPKCLQVSPCANSCSVITTSRLIHASTTDSQRRLLLNDRNRSCLLTHRSQSAAAIDSAESATKPAVQKQRIRGSSQVKNRSGSNRLLRQKRRLCRSGLRGFEEVD